MGIVEVFLAGLCLNANCTSEDNYSTAANSDGEVERWRNLTQQLKGRHFRIATLQNYPLSYAINENDVWVGKGAAFEFVNLIQKKYGFDYEVVIPDQEILGNNATGMFGMLQNNEADIGVAFLPVIPTYMKFVRYSRNLDVGEWVVLMRRPLESATGSGLLAPFTIEVWLLILISLTMVGPAIYYITKLQAKLCKDDDPTVYPLPSCVWFVYGALLKQGTTLNPIVDSARMLFATWWIFITILTAFYTANLTAFLTLSQFTLPISEPRDIGTKHYRWITQKGNAIEEAANNELEDLNRHLKGSSGHYVRDNREDVLDKWVADQNYMYIGEKPIVDHLMYGDYLEKARDGVAENDRCTFVVTAWTVLLRPRAFAYARNFSFHEIFDEAILHFVESGIVKYWLRAGLPDTQICPLNLGSKDRQLRNSDLLLTYLLVGAGFLISGLVFVCEVCWRLFKRWQQQAARRKIVEKFEKQHSGVFKVPLPSYQSLYSDQKGAKKTVNGRDYWIVKSNSGDTNLVPMRTPSALLFQYTH